MRGRNVHRRHALVGVVLCVCLAASHARAEADALRPSTPPGSGPGELVGPPRPAPAGLEPRATELTARDPVRAALWRTWSLPNAELPERARRVQRAGLALGLGSLDGPARAVLLEPRFGSPLERARVAVELAPELPAAHAALAVASFEEWRLGSAERAFREALEAAWRHLEARAWLEATGYDVLFGACFGGALGFLALAAFGAFPAFASDMRALRELPAPSAGALAASIALLPAALGEGLAGIGLGLAAFASLHGSWWRRFWVMGAAALLVIALHPLLERRAASHAVLATDAVALAAWATEQGTPTASELARVVRNAEHDPLASRALALRLARQGELAAAEQRYAEQLADDGSPDLLANAASVKLLSGNVDDAIALYEQAVRRSDSALMRFDLAQAYGRAIRLDEQDLALSEAQSLDPSVLVDLNERYNGRDGALVAWLPLSAGPVLARLRDPAVGPVLARAMRVPLAPGALGAGRAEALVALALALGAGLLFGAALRRLAGPSEDLYAGIARLLQTRGGDSMARMAHIEELRARQARLERAALVASWLVPGAAGLAAGRPWLGALGVALFASGASLWWHRHGSIADPLVLGALPVALVAVGLALLGLGYLLVLGLAFALREKV